MSGTGHEEGRGKAGEGSQEVKMGTTATTTTTTTTTKTTKTTKRKATRAISVQGRLRVGVHVAIRGCERCFFFQSGQSLRQRLEGQPQLHAASAGLRHQAVQHLIAGVAGQGHASLLREMFPMPPARPTAHSLRALMPRMALRSTRAAEQDRDQDEDQGQQQQEGDRHFLQDSTISCLYSSGVRPQRGLAARNQQAACDVVEWAMPFLNPELLMHSCWDTAVGLGILLDESVAWPDFILWLLRAMQAAIGVRDATTSADTWRNSQHAVNQRLGDRAKALREKQHLQLVAYYSRALHHAAKHGSMHWADYFSRRLRPEHAPSTYRVLIDKAACGSVACLKLLAQRGGRGTLQAVTSAALTENVDVLRYIMTELLPQMQRSEQKHRGDEPASSDHSVIAPFRQVGMHAQMESSFNVATNFAISQGALPIMELLFSRSPLAAMAEAPATAPGTTAAAAGAAAAAASPGPWATEPAEHGERVWGTVTQTAVCTAAQRGKLDVIEWLHAHDLHGPIADAMDSAAAACQLHVVEWLVRTYRDAPNGDSSYGPVCRPSAIEKAAKVSPVNARNRRIAYWKIKRDEIVAQLSLKDVTGIEEKDAETEADADADRRKKERIAEIDRREKEEEEAREAGAAASLEPASHRIVRLLHESFPELGPAARAMTNAAHNGNLTLMEFLHYERGDAPDSHTLGAAACHGSLGCVRWLHNCFGDRLTAHPNTFHEVMRQTDIDALADFLDEHYYKPAGGPTPTQCGRALEYAIDYSNVHGMEWLLRRHAPELQAMTSTDLRSCIPHAVRFCQRLGVLEFLTERVLPIVPAAASLIPYEDPVMLRSLTSQSDTARLTHALEHGLIRPAPCAPVLEAVRCGRTEAARILLHAMDTTQFAMTLGGAVDQTVLEATLELRPVRDNEFDALANAPQRVRDQIEALSLSTPAFEG